MHTSSFEPSGLQRSPETVKDSIDALVADIGLMHDIQRRESLRCCLSFGVFSFCAGVVVGCLVFAI